MSGAAAAATHVTILGAEIAAITLPEATARVLSLARRPPQPSPETAATKIVVTANPEILMAARSDPRLAEVLAEAALVVADGIGLVLAGRILGRPLPGRVPGIELMEGLLAECARLGFRPFLLGTHPETIAAAAAEAQRRFAGLELAGWHHGYFHEDDPEPVQLVAASRADLLFAGMGAARELRWLHVNRRRLGVPVAVGVGGSFDVLAGRIKRAPLIWQRLHLEWLYRLLQQPHRWRRQLALPRFVAAVMRQRLFVSR